MKKTGIIFDMDGTLWNTAANVALCWTEAASAALGREYKITEEDIMGVMGLTMDALTAKIFPDIPEGKERNAVAELCYAAENDYLEEHGAILYPDLEETLKKLKENYHLYIVSNCQSGYIESFLNHYGFAHYFDDIECYGNNLKVKGENIRAIIDRNHIDSAYYVGDIQGDKDATDQAEASFIYAAYGFGEVAGDVPRIDTFAQLPELMEKLEKERLEKQLAWALEIDKEKRVLRQTHISDNIRRENDAEHAWHMATMAYLLKEYANQNIDIARTMMMCLIHDIVEIDAGDTYAYDEEAKKSQREREEKAAERIFGMLPDDQKLSLRNLFEEFDANETAEAKFAHAMDNLQPLMLNNSNGGGDWRAHEVHESSVRKRQVKTKMGSETLYQVTDRMIKENVEKGNLIQD